MLAFDRAEDAKTDPPPSANFTLLVNGRCLPDAWFDTEERAEAYGRKYWTDNSGARRYKVVPIDPKLRPKAYDADTIFAAGVALKAPSGRLLFLKRSDFGDHAGEWAFPGGKIEDGETPERAALRELAEETGHNVSRAELLHDNGSFHTFIAEVDGEFEPTLNNEHDAYQWATVEQPPSPLHPGVRATLVQVMANEAALIKVANDPFVGEKPDPRLHLVEQIGDVKVYRVDGRKVRDHWYLDFTEGGNDEAYKDWFPPNEIWLDDRNEDEEQFILLHEMHERTIMREEGIDYDAAHDRANVLEHEARSDTTKLMGFLNTERERMKASQMRQRQVTGDMKPEEFKQFRELFNKFLKEEETEEEHAEDAKDFGVGQFVQVKRGHVRAGQTGKVAGAVHIPYARLEDPNTYEVIFPDGREKIRADKLIAADADKKASDSIAMDRGTVRTIDVDGRMHVALTPLSKSNVCEYSGAEIPDADKLGLDPNRKYRLYRDPDELAKAAASFNNIQLLDDHIPVNAEDPQKEHVIGSTGTDAVFKAPYLMNSLVVWDQQAIDEIEAASKDPNKGRRELSAAYRYDADMTPGVSSDGESFDGRMKNIVANHIMLCETGRAGSDVMVHDSKPKEKPMFNWGFDRFAQDRKPKAFDFGKFAQDESAAEIERKIKNLKADLERAEADDDTREVRRIKGLIDYWASKTAQDDANVAPKGELTAAEERGRKSKPAGGHLSFKGAVGKPNVGGV